MDSKLNLYKRENPVYIPGAAHAEEHCYLFRLNSILQMYSLIDHIEENQKNIWISFSDAVWLKLFMTKLSTTRTMNNRKLVDEPLNISQKLWRISQNTGKS